MGWKVRGKRSGAASGKKAAWMWVLVHRKKVAPVLISAMLVIAGLTVYYSFPTGPTGDSGNGGDGINDGFGVYQFSLGWDELRTNEGGISVTWDDLSQEDKDFLNQVQEAAFWFFWNEANPTTGLIRDRSRSGVPSSIASVGFGLSAIVIAENRGWITYEQAYNRVLTTLNSFYDDPNDPNDFVVQGSHGFFYHWVDMQTGTRAWNSEISLIDTSLLIAGVLHAGQHFKGTEIETLADAIYRAVEWDWLLSGGLLKATPEGGVKIGYDEYILSYVLALGSPTHPIPASSWDAMASGYNWSDYGGVKFLTPAGGTDFLAYLYQFPAAWIDFREKHDGYANYWQNAIAALKANRKFCLEESANNGWVPLWGFTANDGKYGYLGYRDDFDGTVAPSAVAAAIPFIPEYAIDMLKTMYADYYSQVWKEYGLVNAFNVSQNWYDPDYVGIDQGNMVMLMEDFRSGLVWNEFMQIPYVINGLNKAGFVDGFHTDSRGFIRDWLVIGPFGSNEEEAFQTDYIGEITISVSPKAGDVAGGRTWEEYHSAFGHSTSNFIDLYRAFQPNENVGAYAFVTVVSDSYRGVKLKVGSDDAIKVWINNELVHSNHVARGAKEDQDVRIVTLQAGTNKVLVKVTNTYGGWGFYLRFTDSA